MSTYTSLLLSEYVTLERESRPLLRTASFATWACFAAMSWDTMLFCIASHIMTPALNKQPNSQVLQVPMGHLGSLIAPPCTWPPQLSDHQADTPKYQTAHAERRTTMGNA